MKRLILASAVLWTLALTACGGGSDPSGTYEGTGGNDFFGKFEATYQISKIGENSFSMLIYSGSNGKQIKIAEKVVVPDPKNKSKFCNEQSGTAMMDCFEYEKDKGIRIDGMTEFAKKVK